MKKVRAEDGSGDATSKVNGEPEKSEKKEEEKVLYSLLFRVEFVLSVIFFHKL